ncbi:hypothetical protein B7463_g12415, partial [Scytalidium lignicola]
MPPVAKSALIPPSQYGRHHLPGFNLPVNYSCLKGHPEHQPEGSGQDLFPTAVNDLDIEDGHVSLPLLTLRELDMIRIMENITEKPNWDSKVFDTAITSRWKEEALGNNVTKAMMNWVIAELQDKARIFQKRGFVIAYNGGVVKADTAVPEEIKEAFKIAVRPLEDTPEKDYHPGSDEKVLDLVHPSLFPLVYGCTKILKNETIGLDDCLSRIGHGEVLSVPQLPEVPDYGGLLPGPRLRPYSDKFQWLPCDVGINADGDCKILSYINNLHPVQYKEIYHLIETVISHAIPLWNFTLGPMERGFRRKQRIYYDSPRYKKRISDDGTHRILVLPEPSKYAPIPQPEVNLRAEAKERGLQVIVKLANIHLTPEKPKYDGESWHVEGQLNEHICATALYYYDSENITESRLAFRQTSGYVDDSFGSEQDDHQWLEDVYGGHPHGPKVQEVLDVVCKEGRLLTFPNVFQHRVSAFELADPTKPGHRKILALFLVDPRINVISTANVPPQQHHWWSEGIRRLNSLNCLPPELQNKIMDDVNFPIHMDEAKALRLELMDERRAFVDHQTEVLMSYTFSFCEH